MLLTAWHCVFCVCRAQGSWRWREAWSNPWSEESSRTAGQTRTSSSSFLTLSPVLFSSVFSVCSVISPYSWCSFILSGLRTFQQTEQSWLCQPASSSETTVSVSASLSASLHSPRCVSEAVNSWKLLNPHCTDSADLTALAAVVCNTYLIVKIQ